MKIYFLSFFTAAMLLLPLAAKAQKYDPTMAWFDTDSFIWNNFSGTVNVDPELIFPDSGMFWIDSVGQRHEIETFATGHVFDVAHELWTAVPSPLNQSIIPVGLNCPFTWDSLQFQYFYERHHPDATITDTLLIYYYHNFADTMIKVSVFDYDGDTLFVPTVKSFNSATLSGKEYFRVDTVLLDIGDEAGIKGFNQYKTAVNATFIPNSLASIRDWKRLLGFSVVYKPGYLVNKGDTLFSAKESIKTAHNTFGVYKTVIPSPGTGNSDPWLINIYAGIYINSSLWLGLYNNIAPYYTDTLGFIPSLGFLQTPFFHSAVYITSTSCPLSVNQPTSTKDIYIKSISPNPASASSSVLVEVNSGVPKQLKVQIVDVFSRLLFETESKNVVGEDYFKINIPHSKGVFFVLLIDSEGNATLGNSKFVVNE